MNFLPVGVPYHSSYLVGATEKMLQEDYAGRTTVWEASDSRWLSRTPRTAPTWPATAPRISSRASPTRFSSSTFTGPRPQICQRPLLTSSTSVLVVSLVLAVSRLVSSRDRGVRIVIPSGTTPQHRALQRLQGQVRGALEDVWSPRLVRTKTGIKIDTPFSRTTGRGILMVGGMTPTTVSADINAAVLNAGYVIELAGVDSTARRVSASASTRSWPSSSLVTVSNSTVSSSTSDDSAGNTLSGPDCVVSVSLARVSPSLLVSLHREGQGHHRRPQSCWYRIRRLQARNRRWSPCRCCHRCCQPRLQDHLSVDRWSCWWSPLDRGLPPAYFADVRQPSQAKNLILVVVPVSVMLRGLALPHW